MGFGTKEVQVSDDGDTRTPEQKDRAEFSLRSKVFQLVAYGLSLDDAKQIAAFDGMRMAKIALACDDGRRGGERPARLARRLGLENPNTSEALDVQPWGWWREKGAIFPGDVRPMAADFYDDPLGMKYRPRGYGR